MRRRKVFLCDFASLRLHTQAQKHRSWGRYDEYRLPNLNKIIIFGYCGCRFFSITLHSEIRDVHRSASDVDYFLRARLQKQRCHSEIRDVHRSASDVDYFFAKLNKLKQVFRARLQSNVVTRKIEDRAPAFGADTHFSLRARLQSNVVTRKILKKWPLPPPSPVGREPECPF
jgi:hypothetical protein